MLRRLLLLIALLALALPASQLVTAAPEALPSLAQECFSQTSQCLDGKFLDYWKLNGALPVFGYPITGAANEVNRDTGQTYLTQWLERNRFEVHPENAGTPYEILLGLLGKDRLAQLGRDPLAEGREAGPIPGCRWFPETGHNVCNQDGPLGFRRYWETNGLAIPGLPPYARSLQLFGLPLTAAKIETNSSGDTVLTQWFERARFEFHPKNPDRYKVLLGLLGREVRTGTFPLPPTPAPPPVTPVPTPMPTPTLPPPSFNNCQADATVAPNQPIRISAVDKGAETVTLLNVSAGPVTLDGWRICSISGNQLHATLSGSLAAGESRVIASQAGAPIWSDSSSDPAALYDAEGRLISYWND